MGSEWFLGPTPIADEAGLELASVDLKEKSDPGFLGVLGALCGEYSLREPFFCSSHQKCSMLEPSDENGMLR